MPDDSGTGELTLMYVPVVSSSGGYCTRVAMSFNWSLPTGSRRGIFPERQTRSLVPLVGHEDSNGLTPPRDRDVLPLRHFI
jgi:hypothetical protein